MQIENNKARRPTSGVVVIRGGSRSSGWKLPNTQRHADRVQAIKEDNARTAKAISKALKKRGILGWTSGT